MHRMQSGGWPYSEDGRDSSKAPSLRVAFLRTAVFRYEVVDIDNFFCLENVIDNEVWSRNESLLDSEA